MGVIWVHRCKYILRLTYIFFGGHVSFKYVWYILYMIIIGNITIPMKNGEGEKSTSTCVVCQTLAKKTFFIYTKN